MEVENAKQAAELSEKEKARANFEQAVGEVLLFLGSHPLYEQMFLSEIGERIIPPLLKKQYKILRNGDGVMTGYASWAMVSEEVEKKIQEGAENGKLEIDKEEWGCGDRLLVVDCIGVSETDIIKIVSRKN